MWLCVNFSSKASFNNFKSEMHGPTCYQCLWYGVIEALNKIELQIGQEVPEKKVKIFVWPVLPYSFSPIDCSVMKTVWQTVFKICNFNHKYLDNQTGDLLIKVMEFLTDLKVYNYHCSMG